MLSDKFISRLDMAKKESVNLKIGQYQIPRLKCSSFFSKNFRKRTDIQGQWDNSKEYNIYITEIEEEENKIEQNKYLK